MSSTLGSIITIARSQIPDPSPTLPPASATVTVGAVSGSTLPAGTYAVIVTQRNAYGETLYAAETTSLVVGANQGIHVVSALLPGATTIRAYLTLPGGAAGSECQWVESSATPFDISVPLTTAGVPPSNSTAYLPDSDGNMFSAATLFSYLNEGIKECSRKVGGLLDYSGVPTVSGQPLYVLPGQWLKITDVWYGGYWVQGGKRRDFFRRNTVTASILNAVVISMFTDRQVAEVNYQPDRNSGVTATTAQLNATATSVAIGSTSVFLLPFGFAQIGTEIVAYSSLVGGVIGGLIRAVGGTFAQVWPSGTVVTELSLFWCGYRVLTTNFQPGQSAMTLPCPDGWEVFLALYVLAKCRGAEQDRQAEQSLKKEALDGAGEWLNAQKGVPSFVQVGPRNAPLVYDATIAGGLIVP